MLLGVRRGPAGCQFLRRFSGRNACVPRLFRFRAFACPASLEVSVAVQLLRGYAVRRNAEQFRHRLGARPFVLRLTESR